MFVYPCEQGVLGVRAKIFLLPETSKAIAKKSVRPHPEKLQFLYTGKAKKPAVKLGFLFLFG